MGVNLNEKLLLHRRNRLSENQILDQVYKVLEEDTIHEGAKQSQLESNQDKNYNNFNLDLLETDRIFHLKDIKAICIIYRLRFLPSNLFKAEIPFEAMSKIKQLEKTHETTLSGFKIMAPSKSFRLKNYDDPLLFAPIGNGYYYLIHKWGNDLNKFRKWMMMPFRNFETLLVATFLFSLILTAIVPNTGHYESTPSTFLILFLFMFKSVIGVIIYFAFAKGKNFNSAIWNSRYSNS